MSSEIESAQLGTMLRSHVERALIALHIDNERLALGGTKSICHCRRALHRLGAQRAVDARRGRRDVEGLGP